MTNFRSKKNILNYIKRPEYYFRLKSIIRRIFKSPNGIMNQKTPWGNRMEIDANETIGNSIYSTRIYDLALSETLWRLIEPGNFVLDIGANIGFITSLCSYKAGVNGKVWAFEPNPLIIQRLTRNIQSNDCQNITLFPFALSDSNKEGFLELPETFPINQGVAFIGSENNNNSFKIELRKLDDLIPSDTVINVLKIDVEGHELAVLKGAQNLIDKKSIKHIVYEDHNAYPSKISNFLLDKGYDIFRIEKGWFNVSFKNPSSKPRTSGWEPTNYLAILGTNFLKKKLNGMLYRCLF